MISDVLLARDVWVSHDSKGILFRAHHTHMATIFFFAQFELWMVNGK